jgi:hypothetical protein
MTCTLKVRAVTSEFSVKISKKGREIKPFLDKHELSEFVANRLHYKKGYSQVLWKKKCDTNRNLELTQSNEKASEMVKVEVNIKAVFSLLVTLKDK